MTAFRFSSLVVESGNRGYTRLSVGRLADGSELSLPLHVVHGATAGPTMLLVGVVHGEEIFAVDAIRSALNAIDPRALRGTLMAVPVANPPALAWQSRNGPVDSLDLNRQFPGSGDGWLSERIAARLSELVDRSDCLVHIDGGTTDRVIHYTFVKTAAGEVGGEGERLSRAFGMKYLYRGPQAKGSLTSYAAERGLPCVLAEIGGGTLFGDPTYLKRASDGVLRVMAALDMVSAPKAEVGEQHLLTRRTLVRIPEGGIFHPSLGVDALDRELPKDTLLGAVLDPYTLEYVAEIRTPYQRSVLLQMRVLPRAVQPGDYAFIIADADSTVST
ncbi:MAG: succinylglutamate desuccinylase/aspartoacylase family protein [Trueperaceae bacterium]|nr:succinylglutamate desuccinylase/aspartoacylase family protein [Trueperaceae bacterium]